MKKRGVWNWNMKTSCIFTMYIYLHITYMYDYISKMYNIYAVYIFIYISRINVAKNLDPKSCHICVESLFHKFLWMVHPRELQRVTMVRVRHVEKWLRALLKKHQLKPRRLWVCGLMTSIFLGLMTQTPLILTTWDSGKSLKTWGKKDLRCSTCFLVPGDIF